MKICGLTRREDAAFAAEAGADYLGVVLVPGSPRALKPLEARRVVEALPRPSVAVVADLPPEAMAETAEAVGASVIQLHGDEAPEALAKLKSLGEWELWKALRIREPSEVSEGLARYGDLVSGLLLDGWHPEQKGGTGTAFPWRSVSRLRASFPNDVLFIAAGGLGPGNVAQAVTRLGPDVVDVSSGVETSPGIKDRALIQAFLRAAGGMGSLEDG